MTHPLTTPILGAILALSIGSAQALDPATTPGSMPEQMPKQMLDAMQGMVAHGMKPVFEMPAHMQSTADKDFKYAPSYMTVQGDRQLTEADFEDPMNCAGCHPKQYQGWQGSMHANAFKDPIFQKLWSKAEKATDGALMNHCGACHSPIGVLTGSIEHDKANDTFTAGPIASKGVSCDVCHTITKTNFLDTATLEHGNASFEIDPQGPGGAKRGPLKDAVSPYHKTEYSELHTQADFCGNCHQIFHPENGFPIERTYDEWKYSPYARAGIVCQDCHMNPVETAVRVAREMKRPQDLDGENLKGFAGLGATRQRDVVHDHSFVGGNAVVTELLGGGNSTHAAAARQRLRNAAEMTLRFEDRPDGLRDLRVEVINTSAGHNLPTSLTDVREIWIHVVIRDDQGRVIFENGQLDGHGELDHDNVTLFNSVARNDRGDVTHYPWEVTRFSRNTTIPPKGNAVSRYTFKAPDGATQVTAEVTLNYRSYGQHLADVLLGEGVVKIPVIEMERETATLSL